MEAKRLPKRFQKQGRKKDAKKEAQEHSRGSRGTSPRLNCWGLGAHFEGLWGPRGSFWEPWGSFLEPWGSLFLVFSKNNDFHENRFRIPRNIFLTCKVLKVFIMMLFVVANHYRFLNLAEYFGERGT